MQAVAAEKVVGRSRRMKVDKRRHSMLQTHVPGMKTQRGNAETTIMGLSTLKHVLEEDPTS